MAENDNTQMTAQEQQYWVAIQQKAQEFGLDPRNMDHLEATEATLIQMGKLKIENTDTAEMVQQKEAGRIAIAKQLGLDATTYQQEKEKITEEILKKQKGANTRGIIVMAASAVLAIVAAVFTHRRAKDWTPWKKVLADIGAFLGAGAGSAFLGFLTMIQPGAKKVDGLFENMSTAVTQFDAKLAPAIAQEFAIQIAQERAAEAAAAKGQHQQTQQQPPQAGHQTDHQGQQHNQPQQEAKPPQKTEAEIIADAKNAEKIQAEIEAGKEKGTPSGDDHIVKREGNMASGPVNLIDRVAAPQPTHEGDAIVKKENAATEVRTVA